MNTIICGAGEVGYHTADVLASFGHNITIIDIKPQRLRDIEERMDVQTLRGNCASAEVLRQAGAEYADALIAATRDDEINLLTAAVAKGVGVDKTIARVHHSAYFNHKGLDYRKHFNIDKLICPEYSTAQTIASSLRSPGAMAIENFARGQIEMQEFLLLKEAQAIGKSLVDLGLPSGVRVASLRRAGKVFIPDATTVVEVGDCLLLAGNADVFDQASKCIQKKDKSRTNVAIMGGTSTAVWLARSLRGTRFSIRLFETDIERAEELAQKLEWVTVINADPTESDTFSEEHLEQADTFIATSDDDEQNILACAWVKSMGVKQVFTTTQRRRYLHLVSRVGIDQTFSPRIIAARQIERELDEQPLRRLASISEGDLDVYRVKVGSAGEVIGKPLHKIKLTPNWIIVAIEHDGKVKMPTADDFIHVEDVVLVIGKHGMEQQLIELFGAE